MDFVEVRAVNNDSDTGTHPPTVVGSSTSKTTATVEARGGKAVNLNPPPTKEKMPARSNNCAGSPDPREPDNANLVARLQQRPSPHRSILPRH
jgi:hypothetical protein